ncbi:unnamed protein product [Closterium sp. NIES-54]
MVQQVLQRFDFTYSSPQATPLSTRHSLSALPSDESVEPSGPYPELVGCLMYLMTCTRPDLAYPLSILARYVAPGRHRPEHMAAAKRVLRYLCSTSGMGLVLGGRRPVVLTGHADASWADAQTTQQSSQGYTFSLGSGSVSWRSTRSSSVLSSSCEAEIYAGAMAAEELRWLTYLLTDLGEQPRSAPVLYVDNKAMLALCREHRLEHRTKHIALRYFLARELQQRGQLRLAYVASEANTADIFTKALPPGDHQRFCTMLAQALPEKASDDPRSGLDFLRATSAPVTPEPPRSTVHDSAARVTPTPSDSPHPVAFTLPPAVASCSKDPPPPSPSPTPSTVRVSVGPPSASSTPKRARNGKWVQSTLVVGGRRIPPPDNDKEAEQTEEVDIPVRADTGSPALTKMQLREQVYLEASINYETKWSQHFSSLVFGKTKDGFPYVKCSICMSYAKGNTRYAMQGDDGGRDLQTQSFRAHEHTDAHKAAVNWQLKLAAGIREGQQAIFDFINSDVEGRPDAASCGAGHARHSSTVLRRVSHTVFNLTVRLQLDICDNRQIACEFFTLLTVERCDAGSLFERVIYQTNLEVQGIHTVRWLSRGDAVRRLCKVLGACIVLLWEHNHKAYEIVTCYKFQFCLFFLADILADMNDLNRCFQRRESTTGDLTERYLTTNKPFGGEGKSWLVNFLKVHKEGGGKQVRVRGVDGEGRPINHLYTMHERKLKGHKQGSTYADCVKLCRQFARDCVDNLNERLDDLGKLGPTKLFGAGKWPNIKAQREKKCKEWLHGCTRLFRHKLPGFDLKAAERELPTFCAIMESHHEMESFAQGLHNFLGSVDSKRSMRRRRPVKSQKLAVAERERKGKQKEGEAVAAGTAGENEDEGEEEEVVEEEDNSFLSDDEDVEEVYFIDKPVH